MDYTENRVPPTRSSSQKRPSSISHPPPLQPSKKRVPLSELTNSSNFTTGWTQNNSHAQTRRPNNKRAFKHIGSPGSELARNNSDAETQERKVKKTENPATAGPTQCLELKKRSCSSSLYRYLHSLEIDDVRRPLPNYMDEVQTEISASMREILVDWLVEVSEEYKLVSDTLYLSISYLDRFLSSQALSKKKLQLLGVCCMLIAAKYGDISPPHVDDFCYITDNSYTIEEVVDMEKDVLKVLNYEMSTPTTKNFLRILTQAAQENSKSPDLQFEFLSSYLAELSLLEYRCIRFLPSVIAASAVFLSRFTIQPNIHPWNATLECCSGYRPPDLKECVLAIHELQLNRKGSSLGSVRAKYTQHMFKYVANLSPPPAVPAHYFEAID